MLTVSALVIVTARLSHVGSEDGYGKGDRVLRSGPLQTQGEMDPCRVTRKGDRIPGADQKIGVKTRGKTRGPVLLVEHRVSQRQGELRVSECRQAPFLLSSGWTCVADRHR